MIFTNLKLIKLMCLRSLMQQNSNTMEFRSDYLVDQSHATHVSVARKTLDGKGTFLFL